MRLKDGVKVGRIAQAKKNRFSGKSLRRRAPVGPSSSSLTTTEMTKRESPGSVNDPTTYVLRLQSS